MAGLAIHFLPKKIAAAYESLPSISGYLSTPLECELIFGSEPCKRSRTCRGLWCPIFWGIRKVISLHFRQIMLDAKMPSSPVVFPTHPNRHRRRVLCSMTPPEGVSGMIAEYNRSESEREGERER